MSAFKVEVPHLDTPLDISDIADSIVVVFALNMKLGNALGKDNFKIDLLLTTSETLHKCIALLFTQGIRE